VINVTNQVLREVEKLIESRLRRLEDLLALAPGDDRARYLSKAFVTRIRFLQQVPARREKDGAALKRCVKRVDRDLARLLAGVRGKDIYPETKASAVAMTREIEKTMEADIKQLSWMAARPNRSAR